MHSSLYFVPTLLALFQVAYALPQFSAPPSPAFNALGSGAVFIDKRQANATGPVLARQVQSSAQPEITIASDPADTASAVDPPTVLETEAPITAVLKRRTWQSTVPAPLPTTQPPVWHSASQPPPPEPSQASSRLRPPPPQHSVVSYEKRQETSLLTSEQIPLPTSPPSSQVSVIAPISSIPPPDSSHTAPPSVEPSSASR